MKMDVYSKPLSSLSLSAQLILDSSKDEYVRLIYADYLMEQNGGIGIELSDPLWIMGDRGFDDRYSYGYGSGYGDGYGYGYGYGDGYGYGSGYGYGYGYGDGYGYGYGYGSGYGDGDGYGYGNSDGYGSGDDQD